jgi:hypothetical protein
MAGRKASKSRSRKVARRGKARRSTARKSRSAGRRVRRPSKKSTKRSPKARKPKKATPRKSTKGTKKSAKNTRKTKKAKTATRASKATQRARAPRPATAGAKKPLRVPGLLDRNRRQLSPQERLGQAKDQTDQSVERLISSARAGHDDLRNQLAEHTETSPVLTAGDVDAKWQDAYAVGDEAPGGDNPTPGQDRVDDIGKALGINYRDDEELKGGDEVAERDRHRWELDPASSEDWPHDKDKE